MDMTSLKTRLESTYNVNSLPTPTYVYDLDALNANITDLCREFRSVYSNYQFAYSFKTNYFAPFIQAVRVKDGFAEVVSTKEYAMALDNGFDYDRIIFNGVEADVTFKIEAARQGAIVNVDNISEYLAFAEASDKLQAPLCVGVRLNMDIGNNVLSRFGIDTENEEYISMLMDRKKHPNLQIKSVHFHIGDARGLDFFKVRIEKLIHYCNMFGATMIDIGGNLAGPMFDDYRKQFSSHLPSFKEYAAVICTAMKEAYPNEDVTLVTETGTALVANALHMLTSIKSVKQVRGQTFICTDTKCFDVGSVCESKDPAYIHFGLNDNIVCEAIVNGYTCIEQDKIIRNYNGPAHVGDKLLLLGCGAYSTNWAIDFIGKKCHNFLPI